MVWRILDEGVRGREEIARLVREIYGGRGREMGRRMERCRRRNEGWIGGSLERS